MAAAPAVPPSPSWMCLQDNMDNVRWDGRHGRMSNAMVASEVGCLCQRDCVSCVRSPPPWDKCAALDGAGQREQDSTGWIQSLSDALLSPHRTHRWSSGIAHLEGLLDRQALSLQASRPRMG